MYTHSLGNTEHFPPPHCMGRVQKVAFSAPAAAVDMGSAPATPGKGAWWDSRSMNALFIDPLSTATYPWGPRSYEEQDTVLSFKELYTPGKEIVD